ncbi:MAG: hypothetical protein IJI07_10195 [Flexilinea sp.]|nr:hypothetical protein [Flexilinea sp.]
MKKIAVFLFVLYGLFCGFAAASAELQPGDPYYFGTWQQEKNEDPAEIEWQVLAVEDGRALLISRYGLYAGRYHRSYTRVTWEDSDMRAWLNGTFFGTAFSESEKERIAEALIPNPDNPDEGAKGGNDTKDRIFLLSIEEAETYFPEKDARRCNFTNYGKRGAHAAAADKEGNGIWWLRSPGKVDVMVAYADGSIVREDGSIDGSRYAAAVNYDGSILTAGIAVNFGSFFVRPALWLELE